MSECTSMPGSNDEEDDNAYRLTVSIVVGVIWFDVVMYRGIYGVCNTRTIVHLLDFTYI